MKKIIYASLISLFVLIVMPSIVLADGGLVYDPIYKVSENEQQAVIFYEDGIETLAISMKFSGDADEFGWLIPTPNKPEVNKVSRELFTNIDEITEYNLGNYRSKSFLDNYTIAATASEEEEKVTVVEEKTIDYYEITTLQATESGALSEWLNGHGYEFPEKYNYLLQDYINNNWYIVAIKIDATADGATINGELNSGQASPILLTFESENIVFPMKLSRISIPENESLISDINLDVDYGSVKLGSSTSLDTNDPDWMSSSDVPFQNKDVDNFALAFDGMNDYIKTNLEIDQSLSTESSYTFEAWVHPTSISEGRRHVLNTGDSGFDWSLVQQGDEWVIFTGEIPYNTKIKVDINEWQHIAGVFDHGKAALFYKNGVFSGSSTNMSYDSSSANFEIGGNTKYDTYFSGYIDEVRVWSEARTSDQILQNYNKELIGTESNLLRYWQFNEGSGQYISTETEISNDLVTTTDISEKSSKSYYQAEDYVHVELYVVSDSKTQLTDFDTHYANTLSKAEIKDLADDEEGLAWVDPASRKYWITRMSADLYADDMKEDLYIKDANSNTRIGIGPSINKKILAGLLVVAYSFLGLILCTIIIVFSPFGLMYLVPTLFLIKKRRKATRIFCYVLQYSAIFIFFFALVLSVMSVSVFYDEISSHTFMIEPSGIFEISLTYFQYVMVLGPGLLILAALILQIIYVIKMNKRQSCFKEK